jgi:hypothetical protein
MTTLQAYVLAFVLVLGVWRWQAVGNPAFLLGMLTALIIIAVVADR